MTLIILTAIIVLIYLIHLLYLKIDDSFNKKLKQHLKNFENNEQTKPNLE